MTVNVASTRTAWHRLAEHVLAPELHRHTGKIGLRVTSGGVGTPEYFVDGERQWVRLDGTQVVVGRGDLETWHEATSLAEAAASIGGSVGAPLAVFEPTTSGDPLEPLAVDSAGAGHLSGWFRLVADALEEFRRRHVDESPSIAQLWPEHFDVGMSMAEVNYGGSPGGDGHDQPYLYVGPWVQREGAFWNEPFGASISWTEVDTVDAAVDFFESGHRALSAP